MCPSHLTWPQPIQLVPTICNHFRRNSCLHKLIFGVQAILSLLSSDVQAEPWIIIYNMISGWRWERILYIYLSDWIKIDMGKGWDSNIYCVEQIKDDFVSWSQMLFIQSTNTVFNITSCFVRTTQRRICKNAYIIYTIHCRQGMIHFLIQLFQKFNLCEYLPFMADAYLKVSFHCPGLCF